MNISLVIHRNGNGETDVRQSRPKTSKKEREFYKRRATNQIRFGGWKEENTKEGCLAGVLDRFFGRVSGRPMRLSIFPVRFSFAGKNKSSGDAPLQHDAFRQRGHSSMVC